ncbi:hypothetical protein [uncultured Eudoraea sp.]|uniref:hypothetical protein n=1 Tax=uncultured Eudoraea sp. TaxID=1035614 RepID=UPI00261D302F|nr:hypothetical protein [uncultured Eudoraea sp.]
MKIILQKSVLLVLILIVSNGYSNKKSDNNYDLKTIEVTIKKKKWIGVWDYSVQDVPPEYSSGVLHITKKKKVYKVQLELPNGNLSASRVTVKKNKLTFSVDIEGSAVDVALVMDRDSFTGESYTPDGTFMLEGKRRM